jgi:osmotically-inducible protein OsmY
MNHFRSDEQIQADVLAELRWDSRVNAAHVGVTVDKGAVTLTGLVGSFSEKWAAQRAAHRIADVLDVANDLRVKIAESSARTDTEIAQAVRQALEWDALVTDERIRSTVSDGQVTLEGEVASLQEREEAERAIRHLTGVREVTNKLTVSTQSEAPPEEVKKMIVKALERLAADEADKIQVAVNDGEVILSGSVHSWEEKEAITNVARCAPGIQIIKNRIQVDPGVAFTSGA